LGRRQQLAASHFFQAFEKTRRIGRGYLSSLSQLHKEDTMKEVLIATFRILCVTFRWASEDERSKVGFYLEPHPIRWHVLITGEAEVFVQDLSKASTILHTPCKVRFQDKVYDLLYIRSGLGGSAITIGISSKEASPYTVWELYTDTPVKGASASSEDIRAHAEREIRWAADMRGEQEE